MTLIDPSDNMVSVMPTYQQHYSIPESIGAEVRILNLNLENHFLPDIDKLKDLVDENTKMITMNSPNNPSGSLIPKDVMEQVIEVARSVDAYVLCDEVYRGISEDGSYMYSVADLYEKGISIGSMSKSWAMAGVRLGWIVTRDMDLIRRCHERRDYDTISCGVIDDKLAALALANKDKIIERNRAILNTNRQILDDWVNATPEVYYQRPVAGTTALVYYKKDMPSRELCDRLINETGVLFTPGECFEMEGSVRIGYAFDSKVLQKGLDLFAEFLKTIADEHQSFPVPCSTFLMSLPEASLREYVSKAGSLGSCISILLILASRIRPRAISRSNTCPPFMRSSERKCTCQPGALIPSM